MITMEMIGKIRRMFFRDKKSLHEIAKRTSLSRNTIRKWIRNTEEVAEPAYQRSKKPGKLTAFHESLEQALKMAEKLRMEVERFTEPYEGNEIKITISLGVAQYRPGENEDSLLRRADQALYKAKRNGRNRVEKEDGEAGGETG